MDLYAVCTEEGTVLRDIFVKSLKDPWGVNIVYWGRMGGDVQDWGTGAFVRLMRRKVGFIIETIKKNMGQIIIWSDIDIQFFGPCSAAIDKAIVNMDMVFSAEHWPKKEVNIGFVVIRCNVKTLKFYETILKMDFETMQYYDQSAVNQLLKDKMVDLSWDILPYQFWAKSHGGIPPRNILMHHANTTFPYERNGQKVSSLELKLQQLAETRDYVRNYPLWKWHLRGKWRFWAKDLLYRMLTIIGAVKLREIIL